MTIFEKILTNTLDRTYEAMEKPAVMSDAEKIAMLRKALLSCKLQLLQSNNADSEYGQEAIEFSIGALEATR